MKNYAVLLVMLLFADMAGAMADQPNVALWASKIEYYPGEELLLRPRLPAVDIDGVRTYQLRVELPRALKKKEMDLHLLDEQSLFLKRPQRQSHQIDANTQTFSFTMTPENFEKTHTVPTMVFDVPSDFNGEYPIRWSVATDGKVVLEGQVSLVAAAKPRGPKQIEFTIWIAESKFHKAPHDVQEMYLKRLKRLGLNGIMPYVFEPYYSTPIDEIDFSCWAAQWARRHGMTVRSYLRFLFGQEDKPHYRAQPYCEEHPEYWATTWTGEKTPDFRVCLTHALDGDKYDDNKTGVGGGKDNPWFVRLYEAVKLAVKINDLQGVWWDFEMRAVPRFKIAHDPNYELPPTRRVCTDLRCRRAFADYAKLGHVPTVEEIMSDEYYELWNDFKCWQNIRMWTLLKEAAKEANPNAEFWLYSGEPTSYSRQYYGVDWTMAAKTIDAAMSCHMVGNNETLAQSYFAASQAGGRRNPLMMSVMVAGYSPRLQSVIWNYLFPDRLRNELLQIVIDWDAMGVALTGVWCFDSQFNAAVRETSAVFAQYEDVLTRGKHNDNMLAVEPANTEYAAWLKPEAKGIVGFFFNNSNETKEINIVRTHSWSRVVNPVNIRQTDNGVSFSVPAWSHRIISFVK